MKTIRVGSRDSKLAIIQAQMVIDAIKKYDKNINVELVTMKTTGDKILDKSLDKIGGKGLFVKELDDALLNNSVDITVHSYKDMPMDIPNDLPIVALSEREDPRDVLITNNQNLNFEASIGCSSKRRELQLNQLGFKSISPLRGNVLTRLKKLDNNEYGGIVLAAAGVKRLGLEQRISKYFEVDEILPSACQGIIAVQARKGESTDYLAFFQSTASKLVSTAERAFVKALDGGCSSPIAAFATINDNQIKLVGMYVDEKKNIFKDFIVGDLTNCKEIGIQLAHRLKNEGFKK